MIRFRSLRVRMVLFLLVLLGAVQLAEFAFTDNASYGAARSKIEEELAVGEKVFARVLLLNAARQAQAAGMLASDFAFREAVATGDVATLASALENHGARIKAQAVLYVDLRGQVIADTLRPGAPTRPFELQSLIARARIEGEATTVGRLDQLPFQLVAVPVRAPLTIGWIVVCFPLDAALVQDLRKLTGLQVSFAAWNAGRWQVLASTLDADAQGALDASLPPYEAALQTRELDLTDGPEQVRALPIGDDGERMVAVLQRPLSTALAGFRTLRTTLIALGVVSLLASVVGSILIALGITRPIERLLGAVRRIRQGDYAVPVLVEREDEIGVLAQGLEHMRAGIADRERRILKLAFEDTLTQLPNRSHFAAALARGIEVARAEGSVLAMLVMDLDRFKDINDALGHGVGDQVLREVALRLRTLLPAQEPLARLGGDEFALLAPGLDGTQAAQLAQRIIGVLEGPILFEGQPLDVGASIGIALFPAHATDAETLVRHADVAMYVAKRTRSGYALFDPQSDASQQEHLSLLGELRRAIEQRELRLFYQPKVTLAHSNVGAAEALIRWQHPTRGLVPPAEFVPFAEHTGYIKVLTRWVLEEAVRQCGEWLRVGIELQIAVNISTRDLVSRELPDWVAELLSRHEVPSSLLSLEITESGFMEDPTRARVILERLAAIGVRIAIDDYGIGYSSLNYIRQLPVHELKIDRSFVMQMSDSPRLATIVRSTIELGHGLGLKVVAEGVEDRLSMGQLRELGCDSAQGYFISPPLPAEAFRNWLEGRLPARGAAAGGPHAAEQGSDGGELDASVA